MDNEYQCDRRHEDKWNPKENLECLSLLVRGRWIDPSEVL